VIGHNVVPGYLSQEFAETIPPDVSVYRNAKNVWDQHGGGPEKQFRNQLGAFGFDENDVEKPAGVLSGGEKIRLAFLRLFLAAPNFLLLDEPTTHLDLDGRRLLQEALCKYRGTILLVSHDIDFVRAVATSVLEITPDGLNQYPGGYDYYREKKLEREAAAVPSAQREESPSTNLKKELRRQRAQERAKIAPLVKKLKQRIESAEKKIAELEQELETASAELFNPLPTTDFAAVNKAVRTIQIDIDRYTAEWEEASLELEKLSTPEEE
jgi:ATP-binding cassette subfamily F protein 3